MPLRIVVAILKAFLLDVRSLVAIEKPSQRDWGLSISHRY